MAKDYKLVMRFGAGVNGNSGGVVGVPGTGITSMVTSFAGRTGTAPSTDNTVSNNAFSCPLAWGGWTSTAGGIGPAYAEDMPVAGGTLLSGHSNRNDMFLMVDAIAASTLTTAHTFVAQASDDAATWVTVGTGDITLSGSAVTATTFQPTVAANTTYSTLSFGSAHNARVGDLVVVTGAGAATSSIIAGETIAIAVGQIFEVATVPSTTTLTLKVPGYPGTTLKNNNLVASAVQLVTVATPTAPTFTIVGAGGSSSAVPVQSLVTIPLPPIVKPYLRLGIYGGASAAGYGVVRSAWIQNSRVGVVR